MKILVVAEHRDGALKGATAAAAGFAHRIAAMREATFEILIVGPAAPPVVRDTRQLGARTVVHCPDPALGEPLADNYAQVLAEVCRQRAVALVVAASSSFSKDVLPRAAGLLDAGMLSDVIDVTADGGDLIFRRTMYAGNVVATVKLAGEIRFLTIRSSAFIAPPPTGVESELILSPIEAKSLPGQIRLVAREKKASGRPDPSEARIIVSGGRAIKSAADFERLVGGLADALGAAVGSSRALVDAGIVSNTLQVGQTGKVVAPELYIALGISGAIQHLAGMKDARVIVAINKDADAPIFEIADYGLVGDLYELVPALIARIQA